MKPLSIYLVIFFAACGSGAINTDGEKSAAAGVGKYWVNSRYVKCIETQLPCDCAKDNIYLMISFDPSNPASISITESKINEETFTIRQLSDSEFNGHVNSVTKDPFFKVVVHNDRLTLEQSGVSLRFEKLKGYDKLQNGPEVLGRLNINKLKKLIGNKEFEDLKVNHDAMLYCNIDLSYVNLIHKPGDCKDELIVVKSAGRIQFYEYVNGCDPKTIPVKIVKKLLIDLPSKVN